MKMFDNFRVLLIGANGQVGKSFIKIAKKHGFKLLAISRDEWDLTITKNYSDFEKILINFNPDVLINAAAYTNVDRAEIDQDEAYAVNYISVEKMAEFSAAMSTPFIHISTDYVFDGEKNQPYTEDDRCNPLNIYGKSKFLGDQAVIKKNPRHIIIRTSWVFSEYGKNFPKTIINAIKSNQNLSVISDQVGGPTSAICISKAIIEFLRKICIGESIEWGIYNFSGYPNVSWYEFALEVESIAKRVNDNVKISIDKISSSESNFSKTSRPKNTTLDNSKITQTIMVKPCQWKKELKDLIERKLI